MSRRNFKSTPEEFSPSDGAAHLPTDRPIAVYYRQSSNDQIGNISTAIQTVDMVAYLHQRGWAEDDIILVDMDAGVSGTKRIEERPGMRMLFDLIIDSKIGAVACQDEDRLFRDITQIQVNIFIEACRKSRVLVITPSITYDFANELTGQFHARQFRFKCEMGAEYIASYVIGRLHRAKMRLKYEGRWSSGHVTIGYMLDIRKKLSDGSENPNWRKYVPFEPYAQTVNEYFRIFLETGGNIAASLRRIRDEHIHYPDPEKCQPPVGYKIHYGMVDRGDGYYPGRNGLASLLTNPAYIGHWCVKGAVVRWNNHPAIVPMKMFVEAFNYLSAYGLDGEKNMAYRPIRQNRRPSAEVKHSVDIPLCNGLLFGLVNETWKQAGVNYVSKRGCYEYSLVEPGFDNDVYLWSRDANWLDQAVVRRFRDKLQATFDMEKWAETTDKFSEIAEAERRRKRAQLSALEDSMRNVVAGIEIVSNPRFIHEAEKRYEAMEQEQRRLTVEIEAIENERLQYIALQTLQESFKDAIERWEFMSRDEKHVLLQRTIVRIEVIEVERSGAMCLSIHWRDGSQTETKLNKMGTYGEKWNQDEIDVLFKLIDEGASQLDICAAFPDRTWRKIREHIYRLYGRVVFQTIHVGPEETYTQFLERDGMEEDGKGGSYRWIEEEEQQLRSLVDGNATQLEIMAAFPYRRWLYIRSKINKLYDRPLKIKLSKGVSRRESYQDYQKRIDQHPNMDSVVHSPSAFAGSVPPHAAWPLPTAPRPPHAVDRSAAPPYRRSGHNPRSASARSKAPRSQSPSARRAADRPTAPRTRSGAAVPAIAAAHPASPTRSNSG